jgi:ATP-dependent RNA helicase DDX19/DBP5
MSAWASATNQTESATLIKQQPASAESAAAAAASAPSSSSTAATAPDTAAAAKASSSSVDQHLAAQMDSKASVAASKDEEDPQPISVGLHPADSKATVVVKNSIYKAAQRFDELGLSNAMLKGIADMKFVQPSSIQARALPIILATDKVNNIIGQAHAGSGKTATYTLGMLSRVDTKVAAPQALCVVPTRELAIQVAECVTALGKFTDVKIALVIPPNNNKKDREAAKGQVTAQIVVGTPGRLLGKFKNKELDGRQMKVFVLDEADQMLRKEGGFSEQTSKIRKKLPKQVQILLFSATFPDQVMKWAAKFAPNAAVIKVERDQLTLQSVHQYFIDCKAETAKFEVLGDMYAMATKMGQSIIFVHTVASAKHLTNQMREAGYSVSLLHGRLETQERDKVMMDFRKGLSTVLITTNVLARGIDVLQVTLVINFDVPLSRSNQPDPETYLHRIGRSGRFGRKGVAITFVHDKESVNQLNYIMDHFSTEATELPTDDLEVLSDTLNKALS